MCESPRSFTMCGGVRQTKKVMGQKYAQKKTELGGLTHIGERTKSDKVKTKRDLIPVLR